MTRPTLSMSAQHTPGPKQEFGTQHSCFNCDRASADGFLYRERSEPTLWWMGLDSRGQAHYVCDDCKDSLYNVVECFELRAAKATGGAA